MMRDQSCLSARRPVVLTIAGHDPSGGAGVTADAETLRALGCHCCQVVTALTEQDTHNVFAIWPQPAQALLRQAARIVADMPPAVIKIGLIGSEELVYALAAWLRQPDLAHIPVVLDPVLAAGGGGRLGPGGLGALIVSELLPRCHVVTPNVPEAQRLSGLDDPVAAVSALLACGAGAVLLTGTHAASHDVINTLDTRDGLHASWRWPRLSGEYHGSGCTLASALAALLAQGLPLAEAAARAQRFTWNSLLHARHAGGGQLLPDRLR